MPDRDPTQIDFVASARDATERLARHRATARRTQGTLPRGFREVVLFFVLLCIVLTAHVVRAVSRTMPAPVSASASDTSGIVRVDGSRTAADRFFLVTVRKPLTDARRATAAASMASSHRNALRAAESCVGRANTHAVSLDAGRITGGSAGLMFALTIVDALEPLDVDGRVTGTGAIAANGVVGPIADIALKARAAHDAGADIFLVPAAQAGVAKRSAPGLRVVGVDTLEAAVRVLGRTEGCG